MSPEVLGFVLVLSAGLCTGLGSFVVFSPRLIKLASRRFLAGSLSFSAGVMIYVSFVEILGKSTEAFGTHGAGNKATLYSTLCFFGGIAFMHLVDAAVHKLEAWNEKRHDHRNDETSSADNDVESAKGSVKSKESDYVLTSGCVHSRASAVDRWIDKASQEIRDEENNPTAEISDPAESKSCLRNRFQSSNNPPPPSSSTSSKQSTYKVSANLRNADSNNSPSTNSPPPTITSTHDKKLVHMGISTALSIAIHNFPEGLATFVATVDEPSVGITLAIAIAVHNIPEGICVSVPIYYATGDRRKAFLWGMVSGVTEPIGAALGWAVLGNQVGEVVYGVMFGVVAGMMVSISVKELLPTAYRYDPEDTVVTKCMILGMALMAFSLVLFVAL